jgi:GxxExxY protein
MTQIGEAADPTRDPETYAIIGAAMMVHRTLGRGFLELVYHEALGLELGSRRIPFVREIEIPIYYKGAPLAVRYRVDFICFHDVLVELKASDRLTAVDDAQIINYLVAAKLGRGLLLNFGSTSLQYRRFAGPRSLSVSSVQSVKSVDPPDLGS